MSEFNKIAIVGRPDHKGWQTPARGCLVSSSCGVTVIMDATTAELAVARDCEIAEKETLSLDCDLLIVVGGDGSMLKDGQVCRTG